MVTNIKDFTLNQLSCLDTILVDLHIHTNVPGSDGGNSPKRLIRLINLCKEDKIEEITNLIISRYGKDADYDVVEKIVRDQVCVVISIQDHNTMEAYDHLAKMTIPENIKIIPGCEVEIKSPLKGLVMDITTYNTDKVEFAKTETGKKLKKIVENKPTEEKKAFDQLCDALIVDNIIFTDYLTDLYKHKSYDYTTMKLRANDIIIDEIIKIPENVDILNNKGYGFDVKKARNTWYRRFCCNPKAKGYYINQTIGRPTLEELTCDVKKCGGFAILAHPTAYPFELFGTDYSKVTDELLDKNCLAGLELVYRSLISDELGKTTTADEIIQTLYDKCIARNLIYTLSSDFHKEKEGQKLFHVIDDKYPISYRYIHPSMFDGCDKALEIIKNKHNVEPLTPEIKIYG